MANADEQVGVVVVNRDEREVAFELGIDGGNGRDEIAGVVPLDQVRDDLGVGLGAERCPSATSASLSSR